MFILGFLSLLQVWFLPGLFVLSFSKKIKFIDAIILSLPLSLIVNYLLVIILVLLKKYDHYVILAIIILEIFIIGYNFSKNQNFKNVINNLELFLKLQKIKNFKIDFFDVLILFPFSLILFFGLDTIGDILHIGDSIIQYNNWAMQWLDNKIANTGAYGEYPPGIPINMSMIYKIMNNNYVEYFSRAMFVLYPSWSIFYFYRAAHLFKDYKNLIKITCFITLSIFLFIFRHMSMYAGLIEPVLFTLTVSAIFVMLLIYNNKDEINNFDLLIFGLIISSAAIAKQTGLYVTCIFPIMFIILFYKFYETKKLLSKTFYLSLPILAPLLWFFYILITRAGTDIDDSYLINLIISFNKTSFFEKIYGMFGLFFAPALILLVFSFFNKISAITFFVLILPYLILYFKFFGYDNRHLTPIIPFLAICVSFGFFEIFKKFKISRINFPRYFFTSLSILIIISAVFYVSSHRKQDWLISDTYEKKKVRGDIQINTLLYQYIKNKKLRVKAMPDHLGFAFLPEIGDLFDNRVDCKGHFEKYLKEVNENHYLLINLDFCKRYYREFNLNLVYDNYKFEIFKLKNYIFLRRF